MCGRIPANSLRKVDCLRQDGGDVLAEGAKGHAPEHSLLYWRKLKAIATSVAETEMKVALHGQTTPKGVAVCDLGRA